MATIVVIGATGHIGSFLTPRLASAGHKVVAISRGLREPYCSHPAWERVARHTVDRHQADEAGEFGGFIAGFSPDVVVDLICYTLESCRQLADALSGRVGHLLTCGSIWVHGPSVEVPTPEDAPYRPLCEYGRNKAAIERYLLHTPALGFQATVIHPGHISGPGWWPINPAGNLNPEVFAELARGDTLTLPNFGLETLHHVHAEDVASLFIRALERPAQSSGQAFHAVAPRALTLRGYAEAVAGWFGRTANLEFIPWERWRMTVSEEDAAITLNHLERSPNCSMEKARTVLDFIPQYSSLAAIRQALDWQRNETGWKPM